MKIKNRVAVAVISILILFMFDICSSIDFEIGNPIDEHVDSNVIRGRMVETAIEAYRFEYGNYPEGDEKSISDQLTGKNPKGIEFIRSDAGRIQDGKLIDVWRTPLRIKCSNAVGVQIQSAGPNLTFDDSDDYHFNHAHQEHDKDSIATPIP